MYQVFEKSRCKPQPLRPRIHAITRTLCPVFVIKPNLTRHQRFLSEMEKMLLWALWKVGITYPIARLLGMFFSVE
jgi:hypothetical protein